MNQTLYKEIIEDTRKLLESMRPAHRTLPLSQETTSLLSLLDTRLAETPPPNVAHAPDDLNGLLNAIPFTNVVECLAAAHDIAATCTRCELYRGRTQAVWGVGNPAAELVFVGEAPGEEEDLRGEPFVGRAGRLLTDIIELGMKIRRSDVYICNVNKCRPPGNATPTPEQMHACRPYLDKQLSLIKPKVICALGSVASRCLLDTEEGVGRLRGRWHEYNGIPLRVTYHPSYLLRTPGDKKKTWEDIKEVMKKLGMPV